VAGTVRTVLVTENQAVQAGQPLFRLDDAPFRVALARAEARVAQARTDVAALKAGYRARQADIALARTRESFAQREQQRQADLAARNFISAARLDMFEEGGHGPDVFIMNPSWEGSLDAWLKKRGCMK
jgi:membrane fusion protein (multidrug efflux system)